MKRIYMETWDDTHLFERAVIRSGLAKYLSVLKEVRVYVMKNSRKKCETCGGKAFIKIVCFRYSWKDLISKGDVKIPKIKPYSVYYCRRCFLDILKNYFDGIIETANKEIQKYAQKEILIEEL